MDSIINGRIIIKVDSGVSNDLEGCGKRMWVNVVTISEEVELQDNIDSKWELRGNKEITNVKDNGFSSENIINDSHTTPIGKTSETPSVKGAY